MKMKEILSTLADKYVAFINDEQKAPNKLYCHPELIQYVRGNLDAALQPLHSAFRIDPKTREIFYAGCDIVCVPDFAKFGFVFMNVQENQSE